MPKEYTKDLIKTLDEVIMKQVFDKDEYIIAVSRAKSILEKIDRGKIEEFIYGKYQQGKLGYMRYENKCVKFDVNFEDLAKYLFDYLGGGE